MEGIVLIDVSDTTLNAPDKIHFVLFILYIFPFCIYCQSETTQGKSFPVTIATQSENSVSRKRDQICPKSRFFRQCFAMFLSYEKIIATILSDFTGGYFNFCKLS